MRYEFSPGLKIGELTKSNRDTVGEKKQGKQTTEKKVASEEHRCQEGTQDMFILARCD